MSENVTQLGLCCLNTVLRKQTPFPVFARKTTKNNKEKGFTF